MRGSFACCMSEPLRYEVPYKHPIHGLGGCVIPETVIHPSTNHGERCLTTLAETNVVLQAPRRQGRQWCRRVLSCTRAASQCYNFRANARLELITRSRPPLQCPKPHVVRFVLVDYAIMHHVSWFGYRFLAIGDVVEIALKSRQSMYY
jgi:hypothetical protein